jgi:hypothetical protein
MHEEVNETAIVLIPKKDNPEEIKDFSLCNVVFKVVSKCLVNRLRPLLQGIISPTQSDFIPGGLSLTMPLSLSNAFTQFKLVLLLARNFVRISWIWPRLMTAWIGGFWKGF